MEAKYLKDQDTGEIYYPRLHVEGIKDLDITESEDTYVSNNWTFTSSDYFTSTSSISYKEYIKMRYVDIRADLKQAAKDALISDGYFVQELPEDFPKCNMKLNLICKNSSGLDAYCTASGRIEDGKLTITAIVKEVVGGTVTDHSFEYFSGCGYNS